MRKIIAADVEMGKVGETFEILPVEDGDNVDTEIEMLELVQLRGGVEHFSEEFPGIVIVDGLEVVAVEREDLKMMTGGDCGLTNAFKFIVGDKEGVEGHLRQELLIIVGDKEGVERHLRQEHSAAKSVQIVVADI